MSNALHILQNGVPRSGNVWLFNQVRRCLEAAGVPVRQHVDHDPVAQLLAQRDLGIRHIAENDFITLGQQSVFYNILDVYRWPIEDLDAYVASTTQVASHSPWLPDSADVYRRFSHLLYVLRDPRDVALSLARFAFTPFNRLHRPLPYADPDVYLRHRLPEMLQGWVEHVQAHMAMLGQFNSHVLFYEKMVADPVTELRALGDFLDLTLSDEQIADVAGATSFKQMQAQQPHHTHRGVWGGWRDELTRSQQRQVETIAGPLMLQLGYPLDATDARDWQPERLHGPKM